MERAAITCTNFKSLVLPTVIELATSRSQSGRYTNWATVSVIDVACGDL